MNIEIALLEDLENQVETIKKKRKNYKRLWTLYSYVDKLSVIMQFSTHFYSIILSMHNDSIIGIILSLYTLSFGTVIDQLKKYMYILENLIPIYDDLIIPDVDDYIRKVSADRPIVVEAVKKCQDIERNHLIKELGERFVLPVTLNSMNCRKIFGCILGYILCFVLIPVIYYQIYTPPI